MESNSHPDIPDHFTWQFSLRTLLIGVAACAVLLSLWKVGGRAAVLQAFLVALLMGSPVAFLVAKQPPLSGPRICTSASVVLGIAIAGAVLASMLALYFGAIDVERLNAPPGPKGNSEVVEFRTWVIWGTLAGAILGGVVRWRTMSCSPTCYREKPETAKNPET